VRVLRFLFGNWYARAYLLVVAAVAVLVALVRWIGGESAIAEASPTAPRAQGCPGSSGCRRGSRRGLIL
jgi:hypothetical protein